MNASKLPFVPFERVVAEGKKPNLVFAGKDEVEDDTIFYDRKVLLEKDKNGNPLRSPEFIKTDFGLSISVHKLVYTSMEHAYYQYVGKANSVVYKPIQQTDAYNLNDMFVADKASLFYSYMENNTVHTRSTLVNSLNVGDSIYIYPVYSYDRLDRQEVTITGIKKSDLGNEVTFEIKPTVPAIPARASGALFNRVLEQLQEEEKIERICKLD